MDPATVLSANPVSAALPAFVSARVEHFHEHRIRVDWGGRHILRGRRPRPGDLQLQSNDYLAIAGHPRIVEAQREALRGGLGSMMSALFLQHEDEPLHRFEDALARDLGYETGILAQSGYNANVGLIQAIAGERVPVYIDMLAHASLWEGVHSAGARAVPFLHNDPQHLERQILRNGAGVVVIDAVYSTNGSLAPLRAVVEAGERHGCALVVDESHSLGTHGERGEGLVAAADLSGRVHFVVASLAKAYCARAGFVACSRRFKDYFACEARPAIFSTALLPHEVAGLGATREVVRNEPWRRERLRNVTRRVREGLERLGYPVADGSEQIVALEAGAEQLTAHVRDLLEERGVFGSVFSAPATNVNRSLLRLSLNAGLDDADVARLLGACADARPAMRLPEWSATRRARRGRAAPKLEAVA